VRKAGFSRLEMKNFRLDNRVLCNTQGEILIGKQEKPCVKQGRRISTSAIEEFSKPLIPHPLLIILVALR
ncbi:unnamed protein product, partial [Heterotrigona itama]